MDLDLIIRNGTIIDGTGRPRRFPENILRLLQ